MNNILIGSENFFYASIKLTDICEFLKQGYENNKNFAIFYSHIFGMFKLNSLPINYTHHFLNLRKILKNKLKSNFY